MPYEVLQDGVTVHKDVRELKNPTTGEVTGRQLGLGKVYLAGEIVADSDVGQVYKDILDDEDHPSHEKLSQKLKQSGGDAKQNVAARLGIPFESYDEMDEDEVVAAMKHLPSGLIQRIKQYEAEEGEGRFKIVHYIIGFEQDPDARSEGRIGSEAAEEGDRTVEPEDKAAAKLTTRDVPEEGTITHGDGITGTGEGKIPHGSQKDKEEEASGPGSVKARPNTRRSRRNRASSSSQSSSSPERPPSGQQ